MNPVQQEIPNFENICSQATESAAGLQLLSDLFWTFQISVTVAWLCAQHYRGYIHSGVLSADAAALAFSKYIVFTLFYLDE